MSRLDHVPPKRLNRIWPEVESWLESAAITARGRYVAKDIYRWLEQGIWQLWVASTDGVLQACACTEIVDYARKRVCRITIACGHDRANWQGLMPQLEQWARERGCTGMEADARKGWVKILKDWDFTHVFIEKELE